MVNQKEESPYLPAHIANYFLWLAKEDDIKDMTTMKLIKLVYFGYAWYYALFEKKLFSEKIEAWRYGPVIPSIYHEFKRALSKPIDFFSINLSLETGETTYPIIDKKDEDIIQLLNAVWIVYKDKNGRELSEITHENGSPWRYAYDQGENTPMEDKLIKDRALKAIEKHKDSWNVSITY